MISDRMYRKHPILSPHSRGLMIRVLTLERNDRLASNCYIMISGSEAAVIDPSVSYERALSTYPELSEINIRYVLLTHAHADHFWEINSYVTRGADVVVSQEDSALLSDARLNCAYFIGYELSYVGKFATVREEDTVIIGDATLKVMEAPGHTAGSVVYCSDKLAFVGDTVFENGGYGRTDLPTGDPSLIFGSIRKIIELNENIKVYSGHGAPFLIKEAKMYF